MSSSRRSARKSPRHHGMARRTRAKIEAESNRLHTELMRHLAHQLKSPLATIVAQAEELDEPNRRQLRERIASVTRLVDQLLAFSAARSAFRQGTRKPCEIGAVLALAADIHREAMAGKSISCLTDVEPDLFVHGDKPMLVEMFSQILSNATIASPQGGVVKVDAKRSRRQVFVEISDQGLGVPPEERERVRRPFYGGFDLAGVDGQEQSFAQLKGYTGLKPGADGDTTVLRSHGLGLAIAQAVAHTHGGTVMLHDGKLGAGLTLSVNLPLTASPA